MLLLTATTDKLQIITDAAVTVDVHASWMDYTASAVTPGVTNTAISTATTTDVVAAPASSTQRNIKTLNISNRHASTPVTITVQYNANTVLYRLFNAVLAFGETLQYVDGVGWGLYDAAGNLKQVSLAPLLTQYARVTGADATTTGQTLVDIAGLSFPWRTAHMSLRRNLNYSRVPLLQAHNTGCNSQALPPSRRGMRGPLTTAADRSDRITALNTATGTFMTTSAQSGSATIKGILVVTAPGNLTIRHLKVTSGTSTVRINSFLKTVKIA